MGNGRVHCAYSNKLIQATKMNIRHIGWLQMDVTGDSKRVQQGRLRIDKDVSERLCEPALPVLVLGLVGDPE